MMEVTDIDKHSCLKDKPLNDIFSLFYLFVVKLHVTYVWW